ncbi:ATP-dependent helicase HrpB [Hymenobacter properus]|uniref:ATP-dependent helicase HrpB n=1 Tax=Hymenobacter properus TaxID=2791026 RepID=A0A931BF33_9BACT|nr:ATP-dependent helicase HrpB [Hymenobacter properus]MBF9141366.1 ATP-dependent helicase HrpB [Hymenobacter properus]MBR7720175.1 ATP-dependent helicase HrpB [Microvirga sp. SRT04]
MPNAFILPPLPDLPILAALPELMSALAASSRVVLEAPPGAGKTTVVPLALLAAEWRNPEDKILVLEPRQLAVRGAAARLAQLLGEPVGRTIGYRVRLDSKVSADTRVEVITEGILTRMIQDDPALEGVAAVVFDEFHERSLNADLGLALALDAQAVLRDDLRILIMSATLEAQRLGQWLPAPVVSSAGFLFPIETHYLDPRRAASLPNKPADRLAELVPAQVRAALNTHAEGDILVFLPGVGDLQRSARKLEDTLPDHVDLHLLHGELPLETQDAALRPARAGRRKVILATSIAETSLTIEGVRVVIDGGFARVPRFVPRTGFTTLETVPVARAAADQRRGRAGRLAPGTCYRLWTEAEHHNLPAHRPPEIQTADLSSLALELALWGAAEPTSLRWLDVPPAAAFGQARELLLRLGALAELRVGSEELRVETDASTKSTLNSSLLTLNSAKPTPHGRQLAALGLPPRLGHLVVRGQELGHGAAAASLAALLAERDLLRWASPTDTRPAPPDLRLRLEALASGRPPLPGLALHHATLQRARDVARNLTGRLSRTASLPTHQFAHPPVGLLTALAYPDRLAQRETHDRLRLVTGQRVSLNTTDVDPQATFFAVAHLAGTASAPRATLAAPLGQDELELAFAEQITTTDEVRYDPTTQRVTGRRVRRLGALLLDEKVIGQPDAKLVARALLDYLQEAGASKLNWTPTARQLQQRLEFLRQQFPANDAAEPWPAFDDETLTHELADWLGPHLTGLKTLDQVQRLDLYEPLLARLPGGWNQRQELDRLAPAALEVPSGSHITLDYSDPAAPVLAVKLQELFGLTETPTVAGGRVPLLLHLLSPGGRPAQVTRDLRSFWEKGYFDVRKDLKGRYPKHPWPDKPMEHIPTKLTKKRLGQ